ncbi:MAG: HAD family hydrolase [Micrococcaceae bacterium]
MLIALDIDGTVINYDGTFTDVQKDAIKDVIERGHKVIFATGRSVAATVPYMKQVGMEHGIGVSCNGAVTFQLERGRPRIVNQVTFDSTKALTALNKVLPDADYAVETVTGEYLSSTDFIDQSFGLRIYHVPLSELYNQKITRLVVRSIKTPYDKFAEAVASIGLHGVSYAIGWNSWMDIAPEGVNKATSLELVRRSLGVNPHETIAVGDGQNDIEMLHWAARGIAMGQAMDKVKESASEVTETIDDDGLASFLNSLD